MFRMTDFHPVDRSNWSREPYFSHYFTQVPCTYSMTVKIDITALRQSGQKLYPAMLYCLSKLVNAHAEFRMTVNENGQLGFYDIMHPCYTIFQKEMETFTNLWTPYSSDYRIFLKAYEKDLKEYGKVQTFMAKPNLPSNHFPVSMIPWETFESFHLNLQKGYDYLTPIFTMGRFYQEHDFWMLPLSIQVHHAVCDGFHVCRFVRELRELVNHVFS